MECIQGNFNGSKYYMLRWCSHYDKCNARIKYAGMDIYEMNGANYIGKSCECE